MPRGPVRRGQLISPFGPGAMMILADGTSVICAGLDHWFKHESGDIERIDPQEFQVDEWRLAKRLNVSHFFLPPDYRQNLRHDQRTTNGALTIPFLRFPQWHYCTHCGLMRKLPLVAKGRFKCEDCNRYIVQVPFIAMCDAGHIQDFPWVECVYKTSNPPENTPRMRLISTGGMTLAALKIIVDGGPERTLANITTAYPDDGTYLTRNLDNGGELFLCRGHRPWLGTEVSEGCSQPLRGSLRSAANVYFAQIHTSIYLPRSDNNSVAEAILCLEDPKISTFLTTFTDEGVTPTPKHLQKNFNQTFYKYSDQQLAQAIAIVCGNNDQEQENDAFGDDVETGFRRQEYDTLLRSADFDHLVLQSADLTLYKPAFSHFFDHITLIQKLRETRAFSGFTRVFADTDRGLSHLQEMLWLNPPSERWLPAYTVFGEGLFMALNEQQLQEWEVQPEIRKRIFDLVLRYQKLRSDRHLGARQIGPRYILLHTLAHLLINRLTFECGYSSAALRERLYVSENHDAPMAGILIYTAAGDAEGTLGGLVRMGKAGRLEPLLDRAIKGAHWCSADPVCMEIGQRGGQGPDSLNLAACHGCCLVPETACEEFNRLLDRGLVVGTFENPAIGFFNRVVEN